MRFFLLILCFCCVGLCRSQVGVNTENPKATLDVQSSGDENIPEGIIAPRLTRAQIIAKDSQYGLPQTGAIVYITDLSGSTTNKTQEITQEGYYYFNGVTWMPFVAGSVGVSQSEGVWVLDSTNKRISLKIESDGTTERSSDTEFVIKDGGGVLIPKVALSSKLDVITIKNPALGSLVFNTSSAGEVPDDITPGYCYWDGGAWALLVASTRNTETWALGEERAFMGRAPLSEWQKDGADGLNQYMTGKNVGNIQINGGNTRYKLLSQAQGTTDGYLVVNGLRLDFWRSSSSGYCPTMVNTTDSSIEYNIVSWSTYDNYYDGTKTVVAARAMVYRVDGNNDFGLTQNARGEAVHGYISFRATGEWYAYSFYLINIDGIVEGYTTARRLR